MNELVQIFNYEEKEIRTITIEGEPWFVAKDICDILELENPSQALTRLDEDEKNTIILNEGIGNPEKSIVNESGFYKLVLRSDKPKAKPFTNWVTHDVLPSIRKTGSYSVDQRTALPALDSKFMFQIAQRMEQLESKIDELAPMAAFAERLLKSKDSLLVREYAKIMYEERVITFGEKKLYTWLRENGYLMKNNEPYQEYMKYFEVIERPVDTPFGERLTKTTKITPSGQLYFYHKLKSQRESFGLAAAY
jgi:anti-repressor protein